MAKYKHIDEHDTVLEHVLRGRFDHIETPERELVVLIEIADKNGLHDLAADMRSDLKTVV